MWQQDRGESIDAGSEIALADDVVAIENGSRLVTGELHRHALRRAAADQVARGRAPAVIQPFAWQSRELAAQHDPSKTGRNPRRGYECRQIPAKPCWKIYHARQWARSG